MSDGFQRNPGRRQGDATLQEQLDAARRELATTKLLLKLSDLRLNIAMGMPVDQIERIARHFEALDARNEAVQNH